MARTSSTLIVRTLWWSSVPFLPALALQGTRVRRRVPRLPEAAGARAGRIESPGDARLSVLIIGESTAAGVGVATQTDGVAHRLAAGLAAAGGGSVSWQAVGRNGATVRRTVSELLPEVRGPFDAACVLLGVNDAMRLTSESKWRRGLEALTTGLRAAGTGHIVFSGVPPIDKFPALPEPLRAVMGLRARLLDASLRAHVASAAGASHLTIEFPLSRDYAASDGFHPSEKGYAEWAAQLARHLTAVLRLRPSPVGEPPGTPAVTLAE